MLSNVKFEKPETGEPKISFTQEGSEEVVTLSMSEFMQLQKEVRPMGGMFQHPFMGRRENGNPRGEVGSRLFDKIRERRALREKEGGMVGKVEGEKEKGGKPKKEG